MVPELDVIVKIEQVLSLYMEIFPRAVTSEQISVASLMEGVRAMLPGRESTEETEIKEKQRQLQLNLLKILSNVDSQQVPWTKTVRITLLERSL